MVTRLGSAGRAGALQIKGGGGVPGKEKGMYEGSEAGKSLILKEVKGGPNDGNSVGKGQESRWGLCGSLTWEGEGP